MRRTDALSQLNWRRALWVCALVFLCNPNLHGIDLLPDFVGYALLLRGLGRVSGADESFAAGSRQLRKLAYLSAVRLIGTAWILLATGSENRPVLLLTLCFALAVLELMALFSGCDQLFGGLSYLGLRMGGRAVFAPVGGRKERDVTERAKQSCLIFATVKQALCVIPELAALADASYQQGIVRIDWYRYIGLFRAVALLVGVAVGVWWLIRMVRYFRFIEQDSELWEALLAHCKADEAAHPERLPARRLRHLLVYLMLACICCIQMYISSIRLLPSPLTAVFLLLALLPLRRYLPRGRTVLAAACYGVHLAVSSASYVCSSAFFSKYDVAAVLRNAQVYAAYRGVCTWAILEAVSLVASAAVTGWLLLSLIARYTGVHGAAAHGLSKTDMLYLRRAYLRRRLVLLGILAFVCAAAHVAYYILLPRYDFMWMIDLLAAALFVWFAWLRLGEVLNELDTERMVEKLET